MFFVYEIKKINGKNAKTEAMTSSNFYFIPIFQYSGTLYSSYGTSSDTGLWEETKKEVKINCNLF